MERETITVVTPIMGVEVIIKAWLTGGERKAIQRPFLERQKMTVSASDTKETIEKKEREKEVEVDGAIAIEAEKIAIAQIVVSVAGKTENIVEEVYNLREEDFDAVMEAINKVTDKKK